MKVNNVLPEIWMMKENDTPEIAGDISVPKVKREPESRSVSMKLRTKSKMTSAGEEKKPLTASLALAGVGAKLSNCGRNIIKEEDEGEENDSKSEEESGYESEEQTKNKLPAHSDKEGTCIKCYKMESKDKEVKNHTVTHESLKYNKCKVCENVMRSENNEKEHNVWSHSKVPRHQESNVSANLEHFLPRKNHKNLAPVVKTTLRKYSNQTKSEKILDGFGDCSNIA